EGDDPGKDGPRKGHGTAVKVWEKREFRNLDDKVELGTRNMKVALRRLRKFAREGAADELDIGDTMSGHVRTCQELFSAARAEFKHLESFYFHNCPYESLWRDAHRRHVD